MKNTINSIFTRQNILIALLAICTAMEFIYDTSKLIVQWYRNGGDKQIRNAIVMAVAAVLWLAETSKLGYAVVRRDGPQWLAQANETRHQVSRAFSYEYAS